MKVCTYKTIALVLALAVTSVRADTPTPDNLGFMREIIQQTYVGALHQLQEQNSHLLLQLENSCVNGQVQDVTTLQQAWANAYLHWKQVEAYMLGPVTYENLRRQLGFWPTRETHIQKLIHSDTPISNEALSRLSIASKGYPALEWIFFTRFDNGLAAGIVQRYCELSALLIQEAHTVVDAVIPAYQDEKFLEVLNGEREFTLFESIYAQQPFADWLSTVIAAQYEIRKECLLRPGGLRPGTKIQPNWVDARISGQSLPAMRARWQAMKTIYLGGPGLPALVDWVAQSDPDVAGQLKSSIDTVDVQIAQLPADSIPVLVEHHRAAAQTLAESLLALELLLHNDVAAALQTRSYFTDDDGD